MQNTATQFKKGHKVSLETRLKMSEARRGKKWKMSEQGRKNISQAHLGKHYPKRSEAMKGREAWNKGIKSPYQSGDKHWNWKGGIYPVHLAIRKSLEYKLWRKAVFTRDNFTCIWCNQKGDIEADHIKTFSQYPELRFAIDNGRTLCNKCHKTTETYGNKKPSA
jgi:hypothetical protein